MDPIYLTIKQMKDKLFEYEATQKNSTWGTFLKLKNTTVFSI